MEEKVTKAEVIELLESLKCKNHKTPTEQEHNLTLDMAKDAVLKMQAG